MRLIVMEEGCQFRFPGMFLRFSSLSPLAILIEDHVLVWKVHSECDHCWLFVNDVKGEQPPSGFARADGSEIMVVVNLIARPDSCSVLTCCSPLQSDHGSVTPFGDVCEVLCSQRGNCTPLCWCVIRIWEWGRDSTGQPISCIWCHYHGESHGHLARENDDAT